MATNTVERAGMRHGFDRSGGFVVVDDAARVGTYAYPTSPNAESARRQPDQVAASMLDAGTLASVDTLERIHPGTKEAMYIRLCSAML